MGIAMTLLLALFLSFQSDIQAMQIQGIRLRQTANESARAAALQNDLDSFTEGLITFTSDGAFMGDRVVKANLKMAEDGVSGDKYYKDKTINTYLVMFNQAFTQDEIEILRTEYEIPESVIAKLGKFSVYKNGVHLIMGHEFTIDSTVTPNVIRLYSGANVGDVIAYDVVKIE